METVLATMGLLTRRGSLDLTGRWRGGMLLPVAAILGCRVPLQPVAGSVGEYQNVFFRSFFLTQEK